MVMDRILSCKEDSGLHLAGFDRRLIALVAERLEFFFTKALFWSIFYFNVF